jgi:hypothetical protein
MKKCLFLLEQETLRRETDRLLLNVGKDEEFCFSNIDVLKNLPDNEGE